jgi:hypothetical protein
MRALVLHEDYSREEVEQIFDSDSLYRIFDFHESAGTGKIVRAIQPTLYSLRYGSKHPCFTAFESDQRRDRPLPFPCLESELWNVGVATDATRREIRIKPLPSAFSVPYL